MDDFQKTMQKFRETMDDFVVDHPEFSHAVRGCDCDECGLAYERAWDVWREWMANRMVPEEQPILAGFP